MTQLEEFRKQMVTLKEREILYRDALADANTSDARDIAKRKLSAYRTVIRELQEQIDRLDPPQDRKKKRPKRRVVDVGAVPFDWFERNQVRASDLEGHSWSQIETMGIVELGHPMETVRSWLVEGSERLTERQATYIDEYYNNGLSMQAIADMYGVGKSSVSRVIKNGLDHMREWVEAKKLIKDCSDDCGGFDWTRYLSEVSVLTDRQRQLLLLCLSLLPKSQNELAEKLELSQCSVSRTLQKGAETVKALSVPIPVSKTTSRPHIENWDTASPLSLALQTGMPLGAYYRYCFHTIQPGGISRYQAELLLRRDAGWSVAQTAEEFGIKPRTVRGAWGRKDNEAFTMSFKDCFADGCIGALISPETYRSLQRMVKVDAYS